MALVRVYCGLASAYPPRQLAVGSSSLSATIVDDSGRVLDVCEIGDDSYGYAYLSALLAERATGQYSVAIAADSNEQVVPRLLITAGWALAVVDNESTDDFADRFADDAAAEPSFGTREGGDSSSAAPMRRRALGLARALQAGALAATLLPPPAELTGLKPVLAAHSALATGRHAAAVALREVLRELYPAALRAYPDPAEPVALAVMEALPEPGAVTSSTSGRGAATTTEAVTTRLAEHGAADQAAVTEAITALRVAVAETPRRNGVSRELAATVAETVRQSVAAVRACDVATTTLVNTLAGQVAAPRHRAVAPASPAHAPASPAHAPATAHAPASPTYAPASPAHAPAATSAPPLTAPQQRSSAAPHSPNPHAQSSYSPNPHSQSPHSPNPHSQSSYRSNQHSPALPDSGGPMPSPPASAAPPAPQPSSSPPVPAPGAAPLPPQQSAVPQSSAPPVAPAPPLASSWAPEPTASDPPANRPVSPPPPPGITPIGERRSSRRRAREAEPYDRASREQAPASPEPLEPRSSRSEESGSWSNDPLSSGTSWGASAPSAPSAPRRASEDKPTGSRADWPTRPPADDEWANAPSLSSRFSARANHQASTYGQASQPESHNGTGGPHEHASGSVTPPWRSDDLRPPEPPLRLVEPTLPDELRDDLGYSSEPPKPAHTEPGGRVGEPQLRLVESPGNGIPRSAPPVSADDDDTLLIFAQTRSAWFDQDDGASWNTEMDVAWRAAEQAAQPTVGDRTGAGLPRRVPHANLVPGAPPRRDDRPLRVVRDPASIAAHTSGYFNGWRRGQEVGGFPVGGRQSRQAGGAWEFHRDEDRMSG